jgi:hypothetical protein
MRAERSVDSTAIGFGPLTGKAGEVLEATAYPAMFFRGEKLVAKDSAGGCDTLLQDVLVNGKSAMSPILEYSRWRRVIDYLKWFGLDRARKQNPGVPMIVFHPTALGNGIFLPACPPTKPITIRVKYLRDSVWQGNLYGRKGR